MTYRPDAKLIAPEAKLLYTPDEAAQVLGISRSTLYVLLAADQIGSVKLGSLRRIPVTALHEFVDRLPGQPGRSAPVSQGPDTRHWVIGRLGRAMRDLTTRCNCHQRRWFGYRDEGHSRRSCTHCALEFAPEDTNQLAD